MSKDGHRQQQCCGARKPKDMPGVPRILGADLGRWIAAGPSAP